MRIRGHRHQLGRLLVVATIALATLAGASGGARPAMADESSPQTVAVSYDWSSGDGYAGWSSAASDSAKYGMLTEGSA